MDQRAKERFLYMIAEGRELVEIDEALYAYSRKIFADQVFAELPDRYLVELGRSPQKGIHFVEFFTEGLRFFVKAADCKLEDEGVAELPKFVISRHRVTQKTKSDLKSKFKLQLE